MQDFDASRFPDAGVGLEYHLPPGAGSGAVGLDPSLERIQAEGLPYFDYLEFQPTHCILQPRLNELGGQVPVLLHSSSLSLGSVGIEMDREFLHMTRRLCQRTASPWLAEHISWSRFQGGDTQHFILPSLAREVADTVVANALELQAFTGTPLVLENAPRLFAMDIGQELSEGGFICSVVERSHSGFLLDLDSAICTARALGYDLREYLRSLPLTRLIEVHVGDPRRDWDILRQLFGQAPLKAVTIEWDIADRASDPELAALIREIKALRPEPLFWQAGALAKPAPPAAGPLDGQTLLQLRPGTWLGIDRDRFTLRDRRRALDLELALQFLPLVRHFLCPRTLDSALLLPGALENPSLALLQDLIARGLLQPVDGQGPGPSEPEAADEIWSHWQVALDFYLGTRTQTATPYISVAQMEEQLAGKALQQRQPSAFKDYFSHPFQALDNPLLASPSLFEQPQLLEVLARRQTCRTFDGGPVTAQQLSALLYYTWGASQVRRNPMGDFFLKKTSASGGSLHAIEVYPILLNVQGLEAGLYHYSVRRHGLELLSREDPRSWIGAACGDQSWIEQASVLFLSTACLQRLAWKYPGSRALRVALMDCGHLSQSFALVATALGLRSCTTAALRDETFETRLGLDYLREPVFLLNGAGG